MRHTAASLYLPLIAALACGACKEPSATGSSHAKSTQDTSPSPAPSHTAAAQPAKPPIATASAPSNAHGAEVRTTQPPLTVVPPALDAKAPANYAGLHNVVTYHDGLYSGSVPEGDEGFETLAKLGIHTIISVDGAEPEVDKARAHGMRYVHLPVGYNGVSPERTLEIARAVEELPGPIYVHCHHGKHRSAGATGAAAVTLGYLTPEQATARMKVSGTADNYKGLYQCVADARPVDAAKLRTASNAFPSVSRTSGFVATMVVIDEEFEHVKAIEKAKWSVPADHPDLVPTAVAGHLENLFRGLDDDADVKSRPDDFKKWLKDAATQAQAIENELLKGATTGDVIAAQFKSLGQTCKQCHAKYRD